MNTAELVTRARAGDTDAYNMLFTVAAERVTMFVRLRLGPALRERLQVEDVLQETYAQGHRDFERFDAGAGGSFVAWLCAIADHRIHNLANHHGAAKRRPPSPSVPVSKVIEHVRGSGAGPCTLADRAEARRILEICLAELDDEERQAVLLRFFAELTIDEVADRLGRNPTTTRRLLGRVVERLGARMASTRGAAP